MDFSADRMKQSACGSCCCCSALLAPFRSLPRSLSLTLVRLKFCLPYSSSASR